MRVSPRKGGDHHITLRPLTVQDNTGALKAMEVSPFVRFERRNLDLGVMLYRQGDYFGSIRMLA